MVGKTSLGYLLLFFVMHASDWLNMVDLSERKYP